MKQSRGVCFFSPSLPLTQMFHPCFHRKAVKATLVLLPLLGITYMLFFVNPGEDDISQIVFIYFNSFLQSFQVRIRTTMHAWHWPTLRKKTTHTHSEPCCLLMRVIAELQHFFQDDFSGYGPSYRKMMWSSIPAVLAHNMSPLPALCSQLTGLTGSCGHDCSSVVIFFFFFFFNLSIFCT